MSEGSEGEYRRVLAALDDGDSPMPAYADRLWREINGTLDTVSLPVAADDRIDVVVEFNRPHQRGWRQVLAGSVAVAASAAILAVVVIENERPVSVDAIDRTSSPEQTLTPEEACASYFAQTWSVDRLVESDLESADFDAALLALDRLRSTLAAGSDLDLQLIDLVRGSVVQASLETEAGDTDRARRTLERTPDMIRMPDEETDELRCIPGEG